MYLVCVFEHIIALYVLLRVDSAQWFYRSLMKEGLKKIFIFFAELFDLMTINTQINEFHLLPVDWSFCFLPVLSWCQGESCILRFVSFECAAFHAASISSFFVCIPRLNIARARRSIRKLSWWGRKSVCYGGAVRSLCGWTSERVRAEVWHQLMETVLSAAYSLCPGEKHGDSTDRATWTHYKESHSAAAKAKPGWNY